MFPFKTSLNASTLFPFRLTVPEQIRLAAEAGYEGVELWVKEIKAYLAGGGSAKQIKDCLSETGVTFANAIAFFKWSDADEQEREQGFRQAKEEMEMLAELGCIAAAAPPYGNVESVTLDAMAENFARLAVIARSIGIKPYLEFWGKAKKLSRLSEAMYVAMQSGVPDAQLLLDPFHMYTGGSGVEGIGYMNGERIGIVHVNDYPSEPAREVITDRDRVFPGEGIAPSGRFASLLHESGYSGFLSLELFIPDFGELSALEAAKRGLEKMRSTYAV